MKRAAGVLVAAAAAMAAITGTAVAAPTVTTLAATDVTATSATVNARIVSENQATTYYFEYGTTAGYGSRTPNDGPIKGNSERAVSATLTGLSPSTTYHVRAVATNANGTTQGNDVVFTTAAVVPGSPAVTLAPSKPTVTFGRPVTLSGTVTGSGAGGARVELFRQPYPFTAPFASAAKANADAAGAFSFTETPAANARYRVEAKSSPPATSPEVTVNVRVRVGLKLSDRTPSAGQRVRFSGAVTPAHDGTVAKIQRRTGSGWRTLARPVLETTTPLNGVARSAFSKRLRVGSTGRYRAVVVPTDGDHVRGVSPKRRAVVG
jgi:hypothetical protein